MSIIHNQKLIYGFEFFEKDVGKRRLGSEPRERKPPSIQASDKSRCCNAATPTERHSKRNGRINPETGRTEIALPQRTKLKI